MSEYRFEIAYRPEYHPQFDLWKHLKKDLPAVKAMEVRRVFYMTFKDEPEKTHLDSTVQELLLDSLTECLIKSEAGEREHLQKTFPEADLNSLLSVDVTYRPGVTDNTALVLKEGLELGGLRPSFVASGTRTVVQAPNTEQEELKSWFRQNSFNPLIQKARFSFASEAQAFFSSPLWEEMGKLIQQESRGEVETIDLCVSDEELEEISQSRHLALTVREMQTIRDHYQEAGHKEKRNTLGLPENPTDVELEVFAQSWSEHCKHKIFSAQIDYREKSSGTRPIEDQRVNSLYKTCIKNVTRELEEKGLHWTLSVFHDNAGVVDFDPYLSLAIKVETHNSPSALDPYGGALTGILGVNRDILGCGMGYRPVANTDVFCFGPPAWPEKAYEGYMPQGLMSPSRIFSGVHKGVEDGGNKSGIPTVNGALFFDPDYSGKPLVFCGTVGVAPKKLPTGVASHEKEIRTGDQIVVVGGAVGADGIHGATFSSLELNESSPTSAVQIGDPLMQRRVTDFLEEAKRIGLYSSLTDNGAGGLSSSIGEMAYQPERNICGATVELAECPLKYPGLKPYEIFISESQERMTLSVKPEKLDVLRDLAKRRNVPLAVLGEFNESGFLEIFYKESLVGSIHLETLHEGLPQMQLRAVWNGPEFSRQDWYPRTDFQTRREKRNSLYGPLTPETPLKGEWVGALVKDLLGRPNVASKENWVRQYDHEVQAATLVKPFSQDRGGSPSDGAKIWLAPHGGGKNNAVVLGCGLAPRLSRFDPYWMAVASVDEAVRNVVSEGGDPDSLCLLDNFCWPDPVASKKNPHGEHKLGQLVRCNFGLRDVASFYGMPLVSGKDSMKNDFRGKNRRGEDLTISIQPTLLVTAMARSHTAITPDSFFTYEGQDIFFLRPSESYLLGSEAYEMLRFPHQTLEDELIYRTWDEELPRLSEYYRRVYQGFKEGVIEGCHDVSEGGLGTGLCEMTFSQGIGAEIQLPKRWRLKDFFGEGLGQFIVTVPPEHRDHFLEILPEALYLGRTGEEHLSLTSEDDLFFKESVRNLADIWSHALGQSLEEVTS